MYIYFFLLIKCVLTIWMALRNIFEIFGHFDNLYQHFIIKYDLENTKKTFRIWKTENIKDILRTAAEFILNSFKELFQNTSVYQK